METTPSESDKVNLTSPLFRSFPRKGMETNFFVGIRHFFSTFPIISPQGDGNVYNGEQRSFGHIAFPIISPQGDGNELLFLALST